MNKDRREIARLLGPYFPSMPDNATSDDWGAFLDRVTGLETPRDQPNAVAFDNWRKELDAQGYSGVWGVSPAKAIMIKARAEGLMEVEAKRLANQPALMEKLREDAPLVTAAKLMKQATAKK